MGPQISSAQTLVTGAYTGTISFQKSGGAAFVVMYKAGLGGAYDASAIVANLRPKLVPEEAAAKDAKKSG